MKRWAAALAASLLQAATFLWVAAFFALGPGFVRAPSGDQIRQLATSAQVRAATLRDGSAGGQCHLPFMLALDEVSPHVVKAVLAAEDRRFHQHPGIDPKGLARALLRTVQGRPAEGGSTVTQQLVKNLLFDESERDVRRKLYEMAIALKFEMALSKQEILAAYLNHVYFAGGVIGIEAAARHFYGKTARDLNAYEAATLVGMLKSPRDYAPNRDPGRSDARARLVLRQQVALGLLSQRDADRALRVGAQPGREPLWETACGHFRDWVLQAARTRGLPTGRARLVVTLDAWRQAEAVYAADQALRGATDPPQIAQVDMSRTGAVRAMVGGSDYQASPFNRATSARRSPGSTAKLFLYAEACRQGWNLGDEIADRPLTHDGWPTNHDGEYWGRVTLREGFVWSRNGSAAHLEARVGPARVAETARAFGVSGEVPAGRGVSLGALGATPIEMTAAYAAVAQGGRRLEPHGLVGIIGPYGRIVHWREAPPPRQVSSPACAAMLADLLRGAVRDGTGRAAAFGGIVRGKTGTSNDNRDAWFIGYTEDAVVGVWMGHDGGAPMRGVSGSTLPALTFRRYGTNVMLAEDQRRSRVAQPLAPKRPARAPPPPAIRRGW